MRGLNTRVDGGMGLVDLRGMVEVLASLTAVMERES